MKRSKHKLVPHLIPVEWTHGPLEHGFWSRVVVSPLFKWQVSQKDAQAYFASCYGNVYRRESRYSRSGHPPENHMLLDSLVGGGAWMSITWLDLQKNKKWEESIRMEGLADHWVLLSEMKTKEDM